MTLSGLVVYVRVGGRGEGKNRKGLRIRRIQKHQAALEICPMRRIANSSCPGSTVLMVA